MGEEFLGHLAALAAKLDFLASDPEARFTAAYRWVLAVGGTQGVVVGRRLRAGCLHA